MDLAVLLDNWSTILAFSCLGSVFLIVLALEAADLWVRSLKTMAALRERKHQRKLEIIEAEQELARAQSFNRQLLPTEPDNRHSE